MKRLILLFAAVGMMGTSPPPPAWQPQPWVPVERPSGFPVAPSSPNYRPPAPAYSPQHFPAMNQQPVTIRPDGIPARVGRLRAYGNAIVLQVAAEFVGAYMDCCAPRADGRG